MNRRQKLFILSLLSKLALIGTLYFGFWAFIYEFAFWDKDPIWALMSSGMNLVLAPVSFMAWVVLDMWLKDSTTLPTFKLERGSTEAAKPKEKEEKLPIY